MSAHPYTSPEQSPMKRDIFTTWQCSRKEYNDVWNQGYKDAYNQEKMKKIISSLFLNPKKKSLKKSLKKLLKKNMKIFVFADKKSRIRETKHLSTDADSSTDAIGGGPRLPENLIFLKNGKKSPKVQKLRNVQKYDKISDTPLNQGSLIHREAWFPQCFAGQRIPQNPIFLKNGKVHPKRKNSKTSRNMPKLAILPSTRGL